MKIPSHAHLAALSAVLLTAPALAQGVRVQFVKRGSATPFGGEVASFRPLELGAGGVFSGPADFGVGLPSRIQDVQRVGGEYWAAHPEGVARIDRSTLSLVSNALTDVYARSIVPRAGGGATVFGVEQSGPFAPVAVELDPSGTELARTVIPVRVEGAVRLPNGDYAALVGDGVERLDPAFQPLGPFSPSAQAAFVAAGRDYLVGRVRFAGTGGDVALVSIFGVAITDSAGALRSYHNSIDEFEGDAVFTDSGDLLVAGSNGLRVVDVQTGARSALVPYSGGVVGTLPLLVGPEIAPAPVSSRFCPTSLNSSGRRAAISFVGSDDLDDGAAALFLRGLPAGQFCIGFYGTTTAASPFGNGTLCVDASSGGLVRSSVGRTDAAGSFGISLDFATPGLGAEITAGTTWTFQGAYRDGAGAGFGTTDAVTLAFRP